uniref:hypothetical protein n=1 Tax=Trichocoleus desertorum TaxID=1481672 RepID=UPI0025B4CAFC|nr:hypothetical protein [Trichocoleus desertorum]
MEPILLFLDIEGVLSVDGVDTSAEWLDKHNGPVYPVQGARQFLEVIDRSPWIQPFWISSWGQESTLWNKWSKTRCWPVAYPLSSNRLREARTQFSTQTSDGKYLAARWHSFKWDQRIVWIEDGFSQETEQWAIKDGRVQLVNTYPPIKDAVRNHWRKGIRQWNINLIGNALNIKENIEVSS